MAATRAAQKPVSRGRTVAAKEKKASSVRKPNGKGVGQQKMLSPVKKGEKGGGKKGQKNTATPGAQKKPSAAKERGGKKGGKKLAAPAAQKKPSAAKNSGRKKDPTDAQKGKKAKATAKSQKERQEAPSKGEKGAAPASPKKDTKKGPTDAKKGKKKAVAPSKPGNGAKKGTAHTKTGKKATAVTKKGKGKKTGPTDAESEASEEQLEDATTDAALDNMEEDLEVECDEQSEEGASHPAELLSETTNPHHLASPSDGESVRALNGNSVFVIREVTVDRGTGEQRVAVIGVYSSRKWATRALIEFFGASGDYEKMKFASDYKAVGGKKLTPGMSDMSDIDQVSFDFPHIGSAEYYSIHAGVLDAPATEWPVRKGGEGLRLFMEGGAQECSPIVL